MGSVRLTDALVRRLPAPAKGYAITWDSEVAGFGVRVSAGGVKAFIFNYRVKSSGRERRPTIGRFPNWTVGAGRIEARRLQRVVDQGADPRGELEDQRAAPTIAELIARFELEHLSRKRPSTRRAYGFLIENHIR
jgi:Arm DNA-binding domain